MSICTFYIFSENVLTVSRMVENVLADASLGNSTDLINSLISVLWLNRCDINWLCRTFWTGFPVLSVM